METREVENIETLSINLPDSVEGDDSELIGEEETPNKEAVEEGDEISPEAETPSEHSPENNEAENSEESEDDSLGTDKDVLPDKKEPAPVANETPRERALRKELERVREEKRALQSASLLAKDVSNKTGSEARQPSDRVKELREKYDETQISELREILEVVGEEIGFVRAEEIERTTYQQRSTEVLDSFLKEHPEYLPENDSGDVLWNQFQQEIKGFTQPQNPQDWKTTLEKAHLLVSGQKRISISSNPDNLNKALSKQSKIRAASHSTGSPSESQQKAPSPASSGKGAEVRPYLHGFSDEDLKEMGL